MHFTDCCYVVSHLHRDNNDTIYPNLTFIDLSPLNNETDAIRQESEMLLNNLNKLKNTSKENVDGKDKLFVH